MVEEDRIIEEASALLFLYGEKEDSLPVEIKEELYESVNRLKRDLARVQDGSRPELILSVKMGTRSIQRSLAFLLKQEGGND